MTKPLPDQDYDDGFQAGLHGRPMDFVSPMFDAGWNAGSEKRKALKRRDANDDAIMDEFDAEHGYPFSASNPFGEN